MVMAAKNPGRCSIARPVVFRYEGKNKMQK
jgi:hypothetical protein